MKPHGRAARERRRGVELQPDALGADRDEAIEQVADIDDGLDRAGEILPRRSRDVLGPHRDGDLVAGARLVIDARGKRADRGLDRGRAPPATVNDAPLRKLVRPMKSATKAPLGRA